MGVRIFGAYTGQKKLHLEFCKFYLVVIITVSNNYDCFALPYIADNF